MNSEKMEKHISYLEGEIDLLKEENAKLKNDRDLWQAKGCADREKYFQTLLTFLSDTYTELGMIQKKLIDNMALMNAALVGEQSLKTTLLAKEIKKLFALPAPKARNREEDEDE